MKRKLFESLIIAAICSVIYIFVFAILVFAFNYKREIYGKGKGYYIYYSMIGYFQSLLYLVPTIFLSKVILHLIQVKYPSINKVSSLVIYYIAILVLYPIFKLLLLRQDLLEICNLENIVLIMTLMSVDFFSRRFWKLGQ
jgi:hypothetical protein